MKKFKISVMLIFTAMLMFSACGGGGGSDDPQNPDNPGDDKTISISVINGVTPPAFGEIPVSAISENAQFTGTVSWNNSPAEFSANTVYTATIKLTAKDGYTLEGVSDDFFEVSGASIVSNDADSGIITAEFPATGSAPPAVVNIKEISGVTAPVRDAVPVTTITETEQYTGTIFWNGGLTAKFSSNKVYTATITLTAKTGYTFKGISANYFTVSGATNVTNKANLGVITAVFPVTEARDLTIETTTIIFPSGTEFKMITMPDIPSTDIFPIKDDFRFANVPVRFIMGETEVTYQLWKEVYDWATSDDRGSEKYTFNNMGRQGGDYKFRTAVGTNQHPVTTINWRDTIVWCNALTEYYNANNGSATDLAVVYCSDGGFTIPIRSSLDDDYKSSVNSTVGSFDNPYVNSSAKGFRLPSRMEWEFASRYRGMDVVNTVSSYTNPYFTKGDSASGATASHLDSIATSAFAWYGSNASGSTHPVKLKTANTLGLYDMSGNVREWCFDLSTNSMRVTRGGSFDDGASDINLGYGEYSLLPYGESSKIGFRFYRYK